MIEKLAPATPEALAKCVEYEGTVTKIAGASKVRSKERDDVDRERDKLTCTLNSFVDVQGAIPPRLTLQSRIYFRHRVHNGSKGTLVS